MTSPRIPRRSLVLGAGLAAGSALLPAGASAQAKEIKLGQTMPYSGPASAYGTIGKVQQAYFGSDERVSSHDATGT